MPHPSKRSAWPPAAITCRWTRSRRSISWIHTFINKKGEFLMQRHSKPIVQIWSLIAVIASLLASALTFTPAHAAGIVVNTDTDKTGLLIYDSHCSLREAVANANNDAQTYPDCPAGSGTDTITFAANYTITLVQPLIITSAIIINGNGTGNTIIQANANPLTATYRVFDISSTGNLALNDLTVRNGQCLGSCDISSNDGGGIYNNFGLLTLTNSTVSSNYAGGSGGGIANYGGTLTATNSTFTNNSASSSGGGITTNVGPQPRKCTTFFCPTPTTNGRCV